MKKQILRIATRKSPLALWQAEFIGKQLKMHWPHLQIDFLPMLTSGDKFLKDKLQDIGGKGLFVKELEEAILADKADLAVHSLKDVPSQLPDKLCISAIFKRDNPLDALVSLSNANLSTLPPGSVIGTSSLRRQAQLLASRPDLQVKFVRGNVNTRLDKLQRGDFDALILSLAGLERLGLSSYVKEVISVDSMLPSCGQGALGIECRETDTAVQQLLQPLHHSLTATCVYTERHVNALLGGNCHVPLAIYCSSEKNDRLLLRAKVMTSDGKNSIYDERSGPIDSHLTMANACAASLLANGARLLLQNLHEKL